MNSNLRQSAGSDSASTPVDPVAAYLERLGQGSQRTISEALNKLARLASDGRCDANSLPWHALRIEHTSALRTRLSNDLAPATANKHLAALRGVLKQCWRLGLMDAESYQRAIDLPAVHGTAPRRERLLRPEEILALVRTCEVDRSPAGARDEALFALLFGAALRRAEVVSLDLADYDRDAGSLLLATHRGRPRRRLDANPQARVALERWLARRGSAPGPLFNPVNKGGRIELRRLSEQAIYIACHKRAAEAGLAPVSPEDLRRSFRHRAARGAAREAVGSPAAASA